MPITACAHLVGRHLSISAGTVSAVAGILLIALALATPPAAKPIDDVPAVRSGDTEEVFEVELFELSAVRRLYQALARQRPTMTEGERVESAFNPAARSDAGAISLMRLMPATAQELGVNPFVPEQNIEGGVRYFSQMLRKFGAVDLALVAYNAGPGFAERYIRGQAALYGETREYVNNVLARFSKLR